MKAGARVYVSSRTVAACEETVATLSQYGECVAFLSDVATLDGCQQLADEFASRKDHLNIHAVPIIVGGNHDEIKLFTSFNPLLVETKFSVPVSIKDSEQYERYSRFDSGMFRTRAVDELGGCCAMRRGRTFGCIVLMLTIGAILGLSI